MLVQGGHLAIYLSLTTFYPGVNFVHCLLCRV